ncbi:MAG: hypothetical protein IPF54_06600 [Draconibacterium sp.]|nr:hypothetical protein [Draconibacterium sp.]
MIYQFTINTLVHILTAFAAYFTIVLLWKFRKLNEVRYLIYLEFFVALLAVTNALEVASPTLESKIFWAQFSYLGIAFLPVCYFLFTTAFNQKRSITSKTIAILAVVPIITILLVFTNEKHLLIWPSVTLDPNSSIAIYKHGIGFHVFYIYTETLLFLGLYFLTTSIFKHSNYYKSQIWFLLVASIIPIIGNLVNVSNLNPIQGFDWAPVSYVITGLVVVLGIFRFRMFNIVPLARTRLFEMLNDGVVVVNADGFIEDCNSAVYIIFNWQNNSIIREPFESVFIKHNKLIEGLAGKKALIQLEVEDGNLIKILSCKNFSYISR